MQAIKCLILGAGGIGGYFGARLIEGGADVCFLLRPKRQEAIARDGLNVETPSGRFSVTAKAVTADTLAEAGTFDLVLLSPKAYDLDDAIASLQNLQGKPYLLPFLNGFNHLQVLDRVFGRQRVLGGVAHIAAELTADGVVRQLTPMHHLLFGARDAAQAEVVAGFADACAKSRFDSEVSTDIEQALWNKWVFLATLAGITTLTHGSIGEILATKPGEAAIRCLYRECCEIAAHHGQAIPQAAQDKSLGILLEKGSVMTSSMLRDHKAGGRTEHEHILGALLQRAEGLACPSLRLAYTHMAVQAAKR